MEGGLIPSNSKREGDIVLDDFEGIDRFFDLTVWSPVCSTNVNNSAVTPLFTATEAEKSKSDGAASALAATPSASFTPLALEIFGAWGEKALKVFKDLSHLAARRSMLEEDDSIGPIHLTHPLSVLHARLSVTLNSENAKMILSRMSVVVLDE
jgi:hypothetical protein